jgi:hypothetical protein
MKFKIGQYVQWRTRRFTRSSPDEEIINNAGEVVAFDDETVVVKNIDPRDLVKFLKIGETEWTSS